MRESRRRPFPDLNRPKGVVKVVNDLIVSPRFGNSLQKFESQFGDKDNDDDDDTTTVKIRAQMVVAE